MLYKRKLNPPKWVKIYIFVKIFPKFRIFSKNFKKIQIISQNFQEIREFGVFPPAQAPAAQLARLRTRLRRAGGTDGAVGLCARGALNLFAGKMGPEKRSKGTIWTL